jgi:hypothetical protein
MGWYRSAGTPPTAQIISPLDSVLKYNYNVLIISH